jgi:SNF2 family DNA or RNA helicase
LVAETRKTFYIPKLFVKLQVCNVKQAIGMRDEFFAIGLTDHRLWGLMFHPFLIKKADNKKFYNIFHIITPDDKDAFYSALTEFEKKIIILSDEYNEKNLFKFFSKNKNLKEFHEKVTKEKVTDFIRPFIEKRLAGILELAWQTGTRFFMRDKTRSSVFDEDFLNIIPEKASPVFYFNKSNDGTSYSLELKIKNKRLALIGQNAEIISDFPALMRLNNTIISIRDIEAKKIKPFLTRDKVIIPAQTESQYFKSFVLNTISNFEVNAEGFSIRILQPEKKAFLSLEKDLKNRWVLVLKFSYGKRKILANSSMNVFVDYHKEKDEVRFDKFFRDEEFEEKFHVFLREHGLISYDRANYLDNSKLPDNQHSNYSILEWLNHYSDEIADSGLILEQKSESVFYTGTLNLNLSTNIVSDWFDIHAIVIAGEFEIPFSKFKKNILNGIREYLLPDNSILILPEEWFTRYRELFEFGQSDKQSIKLHKQHFNIVEGISVLKDHYETRNLEKLSHPDMLMPVSLPANLDAKLRPYQVEGFTWLMHLKQNNLGGCLADDMGLGKTIQALTILLKSKEILANELLQKSNQIQNQILLNNGHVGPTSLIIVPASLVHNWINEIKKFAPSLKVYPYFGSQRIKKPANFNNFDVILSSYHTVRQDIETISEYKFHYIILDESQVIKNTGSKLYMAVELLRADHRLALTGTPIENSLTDLWSQMNFINQGLLGNLAFFKKEFVYPIEKKGEKLKEERLKKLIEPFILRRTKAEVATELPEVLDQVIYCSMTEEQRLYYEKEKSGIRNYIFENVETEGIEKSSIIVLQGLTRLRQIANHPLLVDHEFEFDSGKFDEVLRNAENVIAEGHKALLFSSFVKHLSLFEEEFKKRGIRYEILTGESTNREDIINAFKKHDDCKLFLISLKAGGVGLNLTEADYVFILDPWWNPASEQQAVSRSHRIGQKNNVFVYRFISENSIEEKIQKLQERKSRLADAFVTSNNPMKGLSKDELADLLE